MTINKILNFKLSREELEPKQSKKPLNKQLKNSTISKIFNLKSRMSVDFDFNKRVLDDVALIPTKRIRNKIAGYASRLMRRIQRGPVKGISLKLQEAERERRMEFVPENSEFTPSNIKFDSETRRMLENYGYNKLIEY